MNHLVDAMAATRQRLARHLVKRLLRRSWLRAVDRVVELGLLAGVTHKDTPMMAFKPGDHLANWTKERFARVLKRALGHRHDRAAVQKAPRSEGADQPVGNGITLAARSSGVPTTAGTEGAAAKPRKRTKAASAVVEGNMSSEAAASAQAAISQPPAAQRSRRRRKPPADSKALLDLVRAHAAPPSASDVATMLMLADAVAGSGHSIGDVLAVLRKRTPVITICAGAPGFERTFMRLLKKGMILPAKFTWTDGMSLTSPNDLGWRMAGTDENRIIAFRPRDEDSSTRREDDQAALAAQSDYPVFGIADRFEDIPHALVLSADLHLQCEPLGPSILRETMRIVLGSDGGITDDRFEGCELLAVPDLALAIRPGMTPGRSLSLLRAAAQRRWTASQNDGRKDDEARKAKKTSFRNRGLQGTGSEIVKPVAPNAEGAAVVPTVETLSGYGEAKDWALALRDDLALWKAGELAWEAMTTRLLLHGPPGTGKTTFAKAVCNTLQIPLVATSVATWLEPGYLGDVLQRMSAAFDEAANHKPAILFIDEIDGIGRRVDSRREHADYWNSVVNRGLELLDGAVKSSGVIVVGATNNIGAIDAALLRAGRLETHIEIPLPDTEALVGILRHHLKEDVDQVVRTAPVAGSGNVEASDRIGDENRDAGSDAQGQPVMAAAAAPPDDASGESAMGSVGGSGKQVDSGARSEAGDSPRPRRRSLLVWLRSLRDAIGLAALRAGQFFSGAWLP